MVDQVATRIDETRARAQFDEAISSHAQDFETFFLARFIGLRFEYFPSGAADAEKELCRVTFPVTDMLRNPQGSLHGGVMATVMDISMGHLMRKIAGPGATIELKGQFMRPVMEGLVTCEGRFTKRGKSLSFMESRLMGADERLAALATATWKMPDQ